MWNQPREMTERDPARRPMMLSRLDSCASWSGAALASPVKRRRWPTHWPLPLSSSNPSRVCSVSVGVAMSADAYQGQDEALHSAQAAMQEAKSLGGGRFVMHRPDVLPSAEAAEKTALLDA